MNKEDNVLELFLNEPTKHWHFEEILIKAKISRPQAQQWLIIMIKQKMITRIKPNRKMPYYVADYTSSAYINRKKLFALEQLYSSGFMNHLQSLSSAKNVTMFGSFARGDWHSGSDIDLFIYGDYSKLNKELFRRKLHREIQIFGYDNKTELSQLSPALLRNILNGYHIKGRLDFVEVKTNV